MGDVTLHVTLYLVLHGPNPYAAWRICLPLNLTSYIKLYRQNGPKRAKLVSICKEKARVVALRPADPLGPGLEKPGSEQEVNSQIIYTVP